MGIRTTQSVIKNKDYPNATTTVDKDSVVFKSSSGTPLVYASPTATERAALVEAWSVPEPPPPPPPPPPDPPPPTGVFTSLSALQSAVTQAAPGSTLALAPGNYGTLSLSGQKGGITISSQTPGQAKLAGVRWAPSSSGFNITRFDIDPTDMGLVLTAGCNNINILYNNIHDGAYLIEFQSANGQAPGSPSGNPVEAPISNCVIRGNKIVRASENAYRICNFRNILIEENRVAEIVESGTHVDGLQTIFGGDGLTYRRNYHHDTKSQQFFIKDGQCKNVILEDNLFVRNLPSPQGALNTVSMTNVLGMKIRRNTIWNARPGLVIGNWGGVGSGYEVTGNVVQHFSIDPDSSTLRAAITESNNIWGGTSYPGPGGTYTGGNGNMVSGSNPNIVVSPPFTQASSDDYRLTNDSTKGVTWRPADYKYGF